MATFRSGVKILSQVSKKQGCRTFQFRSYSDDRRTIYHRRQSPGWTIYNSRTPLQTSKSWFSLFRRKKSPENKLVKQECGCDLKETCESKRTENDSWLSFLKKKISKDERPPLTCCRMHQARLRKEEEQKALQEGREPEGWKPDVMIVAKESNAPAICKTVNEPQPQPPPQPPPPRAVEVLKENAGKVSSNTEGSCDVASKSFNMRLPYEEFKIPIQSAPPPPVSGDNLQPRKQSPYASGEKFKEGTNFQQCKKFHKQSNLEAIPLTKTKAKNIHKNSKAQKKGKATGVLKPHIALNNNSIRTLDKVVSMKDVKTSSRIIIPEKIRHTNLIQVPVPINDTGIKQSNISEKTSLTSYKHHNSSNDLISEPPMQNIPNTATSAQRIHLDVINENNKTQIQNETVEVKLKFDKAAKDSSKINSKERKLTTKLSPKIIKEKNNLRNPTDMQSVKENSINMNKKNQDVNIEDNTTMKNKFLNLGINGSGHRSTSKYLSSSKITSSHPENTKRNNKSIEEFSPSKNGLRCIKSTINLKSSTNHDAPSKITSSHSLPNINKNNKQTEEPATLKKAGGSIKTTTPSPNSKPEGVKKLSQANLKSESSTKKKVKESWEQTKGNNVNPIRPNDESFISAWKANYSYVGFPRKARIPKKKENLKLSKKGNESTYQLSLPSNIEPFVRLDEGVRLWSTPEPVQPIPIEKQIKKTIRKAPKLPNEEKEPWFTECQTNYVDTDFPQRRYSVSKSGFKNMRKGSNNDLIGNKIADNQMSSSYMKILKYGGRNILDSKLTDKAKCQKEEFLTSYFPFENANANSNLKIKRKDVNAKQSRFVDSKLIGTNYVKNLHIKQNSHNEINNCLRDTNENISQKQEQISNSDALYINDISLPTPCQLQMEESLFNDQYESSLYAEDNLREDLNSKNTRDDSNYCIQSYDHDKNMDVSLSNIQCKNLMTDSSVQSPHENFTVSSPNANRPNITHKHIPFSYEKSYGQWGMLESGVANEKQTQTSWQQVDPNIENVIVTLPKPRTSGSCLTNARHFPNQIVKHTFSSYVGNSFCNQHNRSHNQQTEHSVKEVLLIHESLKKSKKDLLACPEMSLKKNKAVRHKKNKRQKTTDDSNEKYYDCVDTQPFEFKNTNSKPTMKYTKQNFMVQQFQPTKRCYSSYSYNKAFPSFRVLNRITHNNKHSKSKNSFSTLDSETRLVEYAKKDKNTSWQSTIFQPPKYISEDHKNYFQLRNIHSDSEVHRFRRTDLIDFFKQTKQVTTENPLKLNPPQPSFAECIEDPKAETKSTEHKETVKKKYSENNKVKSFVSLKHSKNHQKLHLLPREHYKEKKQKTDCELVKGGNVSYDKEEKSDLLTFTKLPIKCSATQYLIGQQNQLMRSQSYFKLKSIQPSTIKYGNVLQYARNASSYTYIEPFNYGNKGQMQCSNGKGSKSGPPSTDRSCRIIDSGVEKKTKSEKVCNKVTAPGCKMIKSAECKNIVKQMPPCKKVLAPKPSYSECLREKTPPRPFTECILRRKDICPDEKKVVKSYDGCAPKKKEEFECPEPEPEKPKPKKKKKVRDECDEKDECEDVEPFKFKSGYSKSPMKCSSRSTSISQPNLPPVRSYSNIKIMSPEKSKLPSRVSSYINCQTKNLKERIYSDNERSGLKSKIFEFETMSPTGYSGDHRLKEHLSFRKSSVRPHETILSPDKVSLKKDQQFIGLLKQPSLKIKPTYRNPINYTKEEKPQKNPVGVKKDRYVKISLGHSKTSSQKKKTISDVPLNPRLDPYLGQARTIKKEKVLRKESVADPGYSALSFTKNKRDTEKKSTQNLNDRSSLENFPSISLESAKKYSTPKLKDNQDFSKTHHIAEFLSSKSVLTLVNFTPPKIKIKNDTSNNKIMQVPVTLKSSVDFTGNPTKRSNKIKSRSNDIPINFSLSTNKTKTNRNDKKNGSMMPSAHSIDVKMNFSSSKQKNNIKPFQECVFPTNFFLPKTSNKIDSNLPRMQIQSPISNLPITVKNNVSFTISNYNIESSKLNSSPKMTSLRKETPVKNQISTLTLKDDANSSETLTKKSTVNKFVISRKRGRDSIISVSMLKHKTSPDSKIIGETARKKEDEKESVTNVSSNITEPSDGSDPCPKTEYIVTTNRDGNVEDLFSTIKSWFSFLKTKEGFPQSESEITENQVSVSPCKTNHIKEFSSDPLQCGSDVPNCLQSGKVKDDCKDISIPEPEISACPEELLQSYSLAESYPEDLACETDPPLIKPSACEMYFTKNKKSMKTKNHTYPMKMKHHENVMLPEGLRPTLATTLVKHQNPKTVVPQKVTVAHEKSEQPTSTEPCPNTSKINIFSELLSKKSTLQEWHANPQFEMKVHGKVLNKFIRANNQNEDIIQTVHEDKLNTSINTEETLKEQNDPDLKSLDKEIAVKKHNERNEIPDSPSNKKALLHHENLKARKMSNSVSPINKELGCTVNNKNIFPHPTVKIRPYSVPGTKATFKVKVKNHTTAKSNTNNGLNEIKNKHRIKHAMSKQTKSISNRRQSEKSTYYDAPTYSSDTCNEVNAKPKESTISNGYLALINKFPDIMGRSRGTNYLSDIWSCRQKDLPVNFILKVPDPVYPKANPKLDFNILKPVSQDVDAECEDIEDHQPQSSNKVSQRENMAKEFSSVKANTGLSTLEYVLSYNKPFSLNDITLINQDIKFRIQSFYWNPGFQRTLAFFECVPQKLSNTIHTNEICGLYMTEFSVKQIKFILFSSKMKPKNISVRYSGWSLPIPRRNILDKLFQYLKQNLSYYGNISYKRDNLVLNDNEKLHARLSPFLTVEPKINRMHTSVSCIGLHNRPYKILSHSLNLFPLCSCSGKHKQFLMVPSLVHISPRHKSSKSFCDNIKDMFSKKGNSEICTEKNDTKDGPVRKEEKKPTSGSGESDETCKEKETKHFDECKEPPKKEKHKCETEKEKVKEKVECLSETSTDSICPPTKRPIKKIPCEKMETKEDEAKKEIIEESPCGSREVLTKEEIEARKKSFKITELSPVKNPPPLPSCEEIVHTGPEEHTGPSEEKADCIEIVTCPPKEPECTCTETTVTQPPTEKPPKETDGSCTEICPPKKKPIRRKK